MSTGGDEHVAFDDDSGNADPFDEEEAQFNQDDRFSDDFHNDGMKMDDRMQPQNFRQMRRPPGFNQVRSGLRPGFQPGFRGGPRNMVGNHRGNFFMRPGMRGGRGNHYENFGPPVPRGYHPRFGPPRFPMTDDHDDQMNESPGDMGHLNHCNDMQPNNFANMPQMRMRGPPPYMNKPMPPDHPGMAGVPPLSGGQGFNGPPFNSPPNSAYNGVTPPGPPFNGPPGHFNGPFGGPPYGAPFPGRPFAGPPLGPPSGPPSSQPLNGAPANSMEHGSTPTEVTSAPGPIAPPLATPTAVSQPAPGFLYPGFTPQTSEGAQFGLPPPGFGNAPAPNVPSVATPGMPCPGIPSMPMMGPPPMPGLGIHPSMSQFRPPMPFMAPIVPIGGFQPTPVQYGNDDTWVENTTAEGKLYYYSMRTRETRWDRPEGVNIVRQGEVDVNAKVESSNPATSQLAAPSSDSAQSSLVKPPEVAAWTEYHNPEGKAYYHNVKTCETTWEKPKVLIDWENEVKNRNDDDSVPTSKPNVPLTNLNVSLQPQQVHDVPSSSQLEVSSKPDQLVQNGTSEESEETKQTKDEQKTGKENARPVSSTAVHGTPWCVVWTGDGRAFFFNPSQKLSVWEKPDELKNRADVDRLLEKQPTSVTAIPKVEVSSENTRDSEGASVSKKPRLEIQDTNKPTLEQEVVKKTSMDVESDKPVMDKIPVGMEAAKEAEERAARERAVQPLEVRVNRFREMLIEMQVSAFSTWEKELHKIVFDPRYLLLASKERKQTFEAYVRERADEEKREKKSKLRERKEKFNELLQEASINLKSSFSEFAAKYAKDDRFKVIEKTRDRELLFQDYIADLKKREKEDKHKEKEKVKVDFIALLKEQKHLNRQSHWGDVKRKIDNDSRYKAVDSSSRREEWFREFARKLDEPSPVREDSSSRKDRERKERQEASIREREKEVKEALSSSLRERDKEREQHFRAEQESNFRSLLQNVIRDPNITWKDAKKMLRKDPSWDDISNVFDRSEREEVFKTFVAGLLRKSREVFYKLLNETDELSFDLSWKEAKKIINADSRFDKIPGERKKESEFHMWVDQKKAQAKENFKELLKETRMINHKTKRTTEDNPNHLSDIIDILQRDKRYKALDNFKGDRDVLLDDYINNLSGRQ